MNNPQQSKSFEERAREMQQREQAQAEKVRVAEHERQQQANKVATKGPAKTTQLIDEAIIAVKQRVQAVGVPFVIPEQEQTGAPLEVLVRGHLLVTLRPGTTSFNIAICDIGSRGLGGQQSLEHGKFNLSVDNAGNFYWRYEQGGGTAMANAYAVALNRSPSVKSAKDLADLILNKAMDLADKSALDRR